MTDGSREFPQYNTVINTTLLWLFEGQCIFLKQDCKLEGIKNASETNGYTIMEHFVCTRWFKYDRD